MDPYAIGYGVSLLNPTLFTGVWFASGAGAWLERAGQVPSWEWLAIAFCLLLSGVFSASETALTSLSHTKINQMLESEPQRYRMFRLWLDHPNRVLTCILIGNNLVNILASALATDIAQRIFLKSGVAIAVGVMTLLILISGEIVPKTYAKYHAKQIAHLFLPLLHIFYRLFFPFTWTLTKIASGVVLLFGGKVSHSGPYVSEADIEYMIDLGTREGVLDGEKEKLLQSILEFDDITIREVMVPRTQMLAIPYNSTTDDVLKLANHSPHSRIPVYHEQIDDVQGILYLRELFRMYTTNGQHMEPESSTLWRELIRPAYFVPGTMKISTLLGEFQKRKKHIAIVVDEFGGTMGLVTLEDILEEIVGEIQDEFDTDDKPDLVQTEEGFWLADAYVTVRELEEVLDIEFPDDGDYETLGGFLTACYGHVPEVGHTTEYEGFLFTVLEANEKSVQRAEIKRAQPNKTVDMDSRSSSQEISVVEKPSESEKRTE